MKEPQAFDLEFGRELFRCRPRTLRSFFALRYQGALPSFRFVRFLDPIIAVTSPILETMILAGMPLVLAAFVLQVILGLKPPNEPPWIISLYTLILAVSIPFTAWFYWVTPANDGVLVHERGFHWRISHSRLGWFPNKGKLRNDELKGISYRSDCFERETIDCGKTIAEKLARIWLDVNLSHHDLCFHLKNGQDLIVPKFFARFCPDDLHRFLDHLSTFSGANQIQVP